LADNSQQPQPNDARDQLAQTYLAQRRMRGLSDWIFGLPDLTNQAVNAGIRDVGYFTGLYDPNKAYQFPMASQAAANLATQATGANIVPPEAVSPEVRQQGANQQALMGMIPVGPGELATGLKAAALVPGMRHAISEINLRRPFEEMTAAYRPTAELQPRLTIDPAQLQGGTILPLLGDRTIAGQELTHINDVPLANPVALHGGPNYPRANDAVWAANRGSASRIANQAQAIAEQTGRPVYGVYSPMAIPSSDFATMTTEALRAQLPAANLPQATQAQFDAAMRAPWGQDFPALPNFPGIANLSDEWIAGAGSGRTKLAKLMDTKRFQQLGFPDVGSTRKALNEPDLLHVPTGSAGYSVVQFDPMAKVAPSAHPTYDTQIAGTYLGGLPVNVPREQMWPDWMATRPAGEAGTSRQARAFATQLPGQEANQQWLDQLMNWMGNAR
jgi:hypothetical protein